MRVLIAGGGTGGHLMPALALADALRRVRPEVDPIVAGTTRGVDSAILPSKPFAYHLLPSEPFYRGEVWRNARLPFVTFKTWRAATRLVREVAPAIVVGTGGYAAGPVVAAARVRGIPIALQEQNAFPGLTTRLVARWARQIHLGFPEARERIRPGRGTEVYLSGNPVSPPPEPRPAASEARVGLGAATDRPVVLIFGGSQGARAINEAVAGAITQNLLAGITLLWGTGPAWWERFAGFHQPPDRLVRPFWDPITDAYAAADLVVARSGAMTTAELCAWGLPAIYVPYPHAAARHQEYNAAALARAGAARVLPEPELGANRLAAEVRALLDDRSALARMAAAAAARGNPKAAETIVRTILALAS
jgi:UDP-N-acetylglucosamine--N-acetylmuramyl-(pentapeptide) pyrophosphoryl-undecaprenol N-acetylglucosamine transferase